MVDLMRSAHCTTSRSLPTEVKQASTSLTRIAWTSTRDVSATSRRSLFLALQNLAAMTTSQVVAEAHLWNLNVRTASPEHKLQTEDVNVAAAASVEAVMMMTTLAWMAC